MTKDEVQLDLDDAIRTTTGKAMPFHRDTRISAITQDSLETLELLITLEQKFDRTFDDMEDARIHAGTYGELLDYLCRKLNVVEAKGNYGDLDWPAPNYYDPSKRGFQPK